MKNSKLKKKMLWTGNYLTTDKPYLQTHHPSWAVQPTNTDNTLLSTAKISICTEMLSFAVSAYLTDCINCSVTFTLHTYSTHSLLAQFYIKTPKQET